MNYRVDGVKKSASNVINLSVNAADLLAQLRSYGLGLVLAHQDLDQLSKVRGLEQAVLANARSKMVFQTSARDARVMQREFGRLVSDEDFISLGAYEAIACRHERRRQRADHHHDRPAVEDRRHRQRCQGCQSYPLWPSDCSSGD